MNPIVIVIPVVVIFAGVLLFAAARRRDTGEAIGLLSRETVNRDRGESDALAEQEQRVTGREIERAAVTAAIEPVAESQLAPYVPPDPETLGVTRRQFLNRSIVLVMGAALATFGASMLAFLWPQPKGGFGSKVRLGSVQDIQTEITAAKGFLYKAEGRLYVTNYPASSLDKAKAAYSQPVLNSMEAGLAVVYQKCPHLGCRVPPCFTSQWFECPCHGSQYNQVGEKKGGPAPRGMDRFVTDVSGGILTVDTGSVIQGPPIGTNTTGQEAEGPHCVGGR
jgi:cytochrome b6-f complex iron-sulfur subunit